MMQVCYLLPLGAWLAFVYAQYHFGDRPVTFRWFAIMAGIGTFESTKGIFSLIDGAPALTLALCSALFAAGVVLVAQARKSWLEDAAGDAPEIGQAALPARSA